MKISVTGHIKMKLMVQPDAGAAPLIEAIASARKSIEIMIFRIDHKELEEAVVDAVKRGVAVQALIAYTNRGGERRLRGLEMRLLEAGAVVSRTNDDLARYHGKYMIIDRKKLYVLGFNFTKSDIAKSRSFGVVTAHSRMVEEATRLFTADSTRQPYTPGFDALLVSPANARRCLTDFLKGAKEELLIYDPEVSDPALLRLLEERANSGVKVRLIGKVKAKSPNIESRRSHPFRLHVRAIVRDRDTFFVGSQSLRRLELDMRREVGVAIRDKDAAVQLAKVFEKDWESAKSAAIPSEVFAKKVAKAMVKDLGPVGPIVDQVAAKHGADIEINRQGMEQMVKDAVKTAIRDVVQEVVAPAVTVD